MTFKALAKGIAAVSTVAVLTTGLLVFTGSDVIDQAKAKISQFETMLNGYENNEKALVSKISQLKVKIAALQEELNNKDTVEEEKEKLMQQIETLTEQLQAAEEDLRETQTENERLAAELEAANNKVDELRVVLDGLTFEGSPLTAEELAAITGEVVEEEEEEEEAAVSSINWTISNGTHADGEQSFININGKAIQDLLSDRGIDVKGVEIKVKATNYLYGAYEIDLEVTGGGREIQSVLTKTELNKIVNTARHSINKISFK